METEGGEGVSGGGIPLISGVNYTLICHCSLFSDKGRRGLCSVNY